MKKLYGVVEHLNDKDLSDTEIYNQGSGAPETPDEAAAILRAIHIVRAADPRLIDALIQSPIQQNM